MVEFCMRYGNRRPVQGRSDDRRGLSEEILFFPYIPHTAGLPHRATAK